VAGRLGSRIGVLTCNMFTHNGLGVTYINA
jgi:hypothetical protein